MPGGWIVRSQPPECRQRWVPTVEPGLCLSYHLLSNSTRRAISTKHAHPRKYVHGHARHDGRSANLVIPGSTTVTCADLKMTEGTLFELTQNGWVVWLCMMGLWTVMQVLFNLALTVRDGQ